jgi:hypothetical protein
MHVPRSKQNTAIYFLIEGSGALGVIEVEFRDHNIANASYPFYPMRIVNTQES